MCWLHSVTVTNATPAANALPKTCAMLLAAGRGERMRPLTDITPKPLLQVHGKPLLWYPLKALAGAGVRSVVVNTGWLGDHIESFFGQRFTPAMDHALEPDREDAASVQLRYSREGRGAGEALETAGGIARALPWLSDVFWVAAGDVFAPDFEFSAQAFAAFQASPCLAHIWLVPNPSHNPFGDFGLSTDGMALNIAKPTTSSTSFNANARTHTLQQSNPLFTFSTIALYKRAFFEADWCQITAGNPDGIKAPLAPMLRAAMDCGLVSAALYDGRWVDVGTPERLTQLNHETR